MDSALLVILVLLVLLACIFSILSFRRKPALDTGPIERVLKEEFRLAREESARASRELREELGRAQKGATEGLVGSIGQMGKVQADNLESVARRIQTLTESNESRIERVRNTIDAQLQRLQEGNEKKLDQMRQTVDEKLHDTLEKRLGESFKLVSERLEAVQRGLGEMQNLATGVGDLKKVLTNVKTRGTFGEVQLGAILEQILTPDQYRKNVQTRHGCPERVEYAVALPGPEGNENSCVLLPIDSKFPQEDYLRLVEAADAGDSERMQKMTANLVRTIHNSARDISDKYLDPPRTTDFAIMFLPTEGLYAEILRQPGLVEELQMKHRIVMAGPTTLSAILSSLRMGFQTLAIEQRSHEVWTILGAVKTEFGKFGDVLQRVKKQLNTAASTIDETEVRTRAMERTLRNVEKLPAGSAAHILEIDEARMTALDEEEYKEEDNDI